MKYKLPIILLIFFSLESFCQNKKTIDISAYYKGDTAQWRKEWCKFSDQLKLDNLINSGDTFHFRYWQDRQVLDIWTNDYKTFHGLVTNFAIKYNPDNLKKKKPIPNKVFSNQIKLDTSIAHEAYKSIVDCLVLDIPSEGKIKDWKWGCDGMTYDFEISTKNSYLYKAYWSPDAQDSTLAEARQIESFIVRINALLKLNKEFDKFSITLPYGSYRFKYSIIRLVVGEYNPNYSDNNNENTLDDARDEFYY